MHAPLSEVTDRLEAIVEAHRAIGSPFGVYLRRPALPDEVRDRLATLELDAPDELVKLYGWHDGIDEDAWNDAHVRRPPPEIVPGYTFPSLRKAAAWCRERRALQEEIWGDERPEPGAVRLGGVWLPEWFPVLVGLPFGLAFDCPSRSVWVVSGGPDDVDPTEPIGSLPEVLDAMIDRFRSGAYYWSTASQSPASYGFRHPGGAGETGLTRGTSDGDFLVRPVAGTQAETYEYVGPEGRLAFDLDVELRALERVRRDGRGVRSIDEFQIGWFDRPGRPPADVRDRVLRRLVGYFEAQGMPCDVRLASGALRDSTGRVRPGYRQWRSSWSHSDGWGIVDFWIAGSWRDTGGVDFEPLSRWDRRGPYPDTIEYREGGGAWRARLARRRRWLPAAELPPQPWDGDAFIADLVYPESAVRVGDAGATITNADRERIGRRIKELAADTGHLYLVRAGIPEAEPGSAPPSDEEYASYPFPVPGDRA